MAIQTIPLSPSSSSSSSSSSSLSQPKKASTFSSTSTTTPTPSSSSSSFPPPSFSSSSSQSSLVILNDSKNDPDYYSLSYGLKHFPINWPQALFLCFTPILGLLGAFYVKLTWPTFLWACVYYFYSGLGITAGYHRLWSHKSYTSTWPFRLYMALAGSAAVQGSIKWWARHHRAHHRYTDTNKDPYSAHKGLFWSHFGWMLFKKHHASLNKIDISDLLNDPIVQIQHQLYLPLALFMTFIFPTFIASFFWNDPYGGFVYAGLIRLVFVHHATFCVNSLAHWIGDRPFDDRRTPRDHFITALVTLGEGYHNFHHEFPNDYRNAIKFYQYDPTKWLIRIAHLLGLVSNLKQVPKDAIEKGQINMIQKKLDLWKSRLDWGIKEEELPLWDENQFREELLLNPFLIRLHSYVYDVSLFIHDHPGGPNMLKAYLGKDGTKAFEGDTYFHSTAARNIASTLRVAKLQSMSTSFSTSTTTSTSLKMNSMDSATFMDENRASSTSCTAYTSSFHTCSSRSASTSNLLLT